MGTESGSRLRRAPPGGGVGGKHSFITQVWAELPCTILSVSQRGRSGRISQKGNTWDNFVNAASQLSEGKPFQRSVVATRLQPLEREHRAATVCLDDPPGPLELAELKHPQPHLRRCATSTSSQVSADMLTEAP